MHDFEVTDLSACELASPVFPLSNSLIMEATTAAWSGATCSMSRRRHRNPGNRAMLINWSLMTVPKVKDTNKMEMLISSSKELIYKI